MSDALTTQLVGVVSENANGVFSAHPAIIAADALARYFVSARQPMSRRQKPPGQSIWLTAV